MSGGPHGAGAAGVAEPPRPSLARVVGGYVAGIAAASLATSAGFLIRSVLAKGEFPPPYEWVMLAILTAVLFVLGLPLGGLPALVVVLIGRRTGMGGVGFFAVAGAVVPLLLIPVLLSAAAFADGYGYLVDLPGSARAKFGIAMMLYGAVAGAIYARIARPPRP